MLFIVVAFDLRCVCCDVLCCVVVVVVINGLFDQRTFGSTDFWINELLDQRTSMGQRTFSSKGMLSSDLLGFQTYDYARHFISACERVLKVFLRGGGALVMCLCCDCHVFAKCRASVVICHVSVLLANVCDL